MGGLDRCCDGRRYEGMPSLLIFGDSVIDCLVTLGLDTVHTGSVPLYHLNRGPFKRVGAVNISPC